MKKMMRNIAALVIAATLSFGGFGVAALADITEVNETVYSQNVLQPTYEGDPYDRLKK
ncbi:MAG: hypothetical protein FWG63_07500 [Defluviitaleaceae bacterium]|nr:hypothetical protein [Defluviitaleaceae bacterium]